MQQSIRYTKTLGNAAIYFRLRGKEANAGKFWNFVTLAWVTPQVNDCRVFATEYADSDPYDSEYAAEVTIPAGGPYIVEAVLASNSEALGSDTTALDETVSSRALDSTVAKDANIETHVTASLNTYDPPTRTEATADKDAIIVQVDANETKIDRVLGLVLDNAVEDDIVRDGSGNKTSSILYHYNSAANATTHDKATGLVGKYNVTAAYTDNKMTLFKTPRVI